AGRATAYPDDDADGFGDATRPVSACDLPASTVADATDCLDTDGAVNPAAAEVCDDAVDNDCDGEVDEGCAGSIDACDGANTGDTYSDGTSMGGPDLLLGMAYTPDASVDVGRVEVFTGEGTGTNRVSVWTDVGGAPDTEIAGGSWDMDRANGWQGADLDACVPLEAGVTYWLVWAPINGSQATWDTSGERVRYRGSYDGGRSWNGPYENHVKYRVSCCE
ncbi:MAG: putative metal-binding motif-containing protein, partial [Myxococcota bacterium]